MYTVTVWHRSHDQAPKRIAEPVPTIAKRVRVQSGTLPDPYRAVTSNLLSDDRHIHDESSRNDNILPEANR